MFPGNTRRDVIRAREEACRARFARCCRTNTNWTPFPKPHLGNRRREGSVRRVLRWRIALPTSLGGRSHVSACLASTKRVSVTANKTPAPATSRSLSSDNITEFSTRLGAQFLNNLIKLDFLPKRPTNPESCPANSRLASTTDARTVSQDATKGGASDKLLWPSAQLRLHRQPESANPRNSGERFRVFVILFNRLCRWRTVSPPIMRFNKPECIPNHAVNYCFTIVYCPELLQVLRI
jgi:hypothetical protein